MFIRRAAFVASPHPVSPSPRSMGADPPPFEEGEGGPPFRMMVSRPVYFTPQKRLSNELAGTIGWAPATSASFVGGAAAGSETVGLNGGRVAAATLVSAGFGAAAGLGTAAADRGVSLAWMTFGLAGTAVEVVSA